MDALMIFRKSIHRGASAWGWVFVVLASIGCGESATSLLALKLPPAEAASRAMAAYDKNADAHLSAEELKAAPSLVSSMARLDADKNGELTEAEIKQRLEAVDRGSDLVAVSTSVVGPRGPVAQAQVTLTPEPFHGEGLQSYSGTTNRGGSCQLQGAAVQLPGLPAGFYQAHVVQESHNLDVTLGCEIADDASGSRLELKVK